MRKTAENKMVEPGFAPDPEQPIGGGGFGDGKATPAPEPEPEEDQE